MHNRIDRSGITFEQLGNGRSIPNVEVMVIIAGDVRDQVTPALEPALNNREEFGHMRFKCAICDAAGHVVPHPTQEIR